VSRAREYTAPVNVPDQEDLAIDLVPGNLVRRREQERSDADYVSAAFWTLFGTELGILVDVLGLGAGKMDRPTAIIVTIIGAFTLLCLITMILLKLRVRSTSRKIDQVSRSGSGH
jgi:hypothetical protein